MLSVRRKEDMEQIDAVDNQHGNSKAMMKLIFTLRDRDDKWFVHLVAVTRQCEYILDDINPRLKEAGHNILECDGSSLHTVGFCSYTSPCFRGLIMVALCNRADHYIFMLWFVMVALCNRETIYIFAL